MNILIIYNIKALSHYLSHYLRYDNISRLIHVITCIFVKDYNSYFFNLFNLLFILVLFRLAFLSLSGSISLSKLPWQRNILLPRPHET